MVNKTKKKHSFLTHTCIGASICISQEIQFLPYATFLQFYNTNQENNSMVKKCNFLITLISVTNLWKVGCLKTKQTKQAPSIISTYKINKKSELKKKKFGLKIQLKC